jgi:hypothetical protein
VLKLMKRIVNEIESLEYLFDEIEDEKEREFVSGRLSALRWALNRVVETNMEMRAEELNESEGVK